MLISTFSTVIIMNLKSPKVIVYFISRKYCFSFLPFPPKCDLSERSIEGRNSNYRELSKARE